MDEVKPIVLPTVEDYLNNIDYEFKGYMPTDEALRFVNFIKAVNGGEEENKTPIVHLVMMDRVFNSERRCAIMCFRGIGKCLDITAEVVTPHGPVFLEDIKVGDKVLDRNGDVTDVTYCSPIYTDKKCYRVVLDNNDSFVASYDHKHIVKRRTQSSKGVNGFVEEELTTDEILEKGVYYNRTVGPRTPTGREVKWYIPLPDKPIEYVAKEVVIDPYTMGYMLGDGNFTGSNVTIGKKGLESFLSNTPHKVASIKYGRRNSNVCRVSFKQLKEAQPLYTKDIDFVKRNKYIHEDYLFNTVDVRHSVLQGLLDSDGTVSVGGSISFSNMSLNLCEGVVSLVHSLGGKAKLSEKLVNGTMYYNVSVYMPKEYCPFRLQRKADRWYNSYREVRPMVGILDIVEVEPVATKCIAVSSNTHSYIFNRGYITHNTTLFSEYLILYIAAFGYMPGFGEVNLMLYVTDSIENGVKNLRRNVEYRYQESEFLQHMIPNQSIKIGTEGAGYVDLNEYESQTAGGRKFTDIRMELVNNKGHRLVVKGYGSLTGVRGAKEMGTRPQVAMLDDLMSDEGARSSVVVETIKNTIYKAVSKALHPKRQKIIFIGTPFNASDPLYEAIGSGAWKVSVFPICERFPVTREEFRGAWEDRFDYDYVKAEYEEAIAVHRPENFYQELMLRIMSDEDRLVKDDDLVWFSRGTVLQNKGAYNFYITTDFATSAKKSADYSVLSVWAYNSNGDWMLVDGVCEQQLMDQSMKDLFRLVSMYRPLSVGIEVTGQQGGFIRWITNEMVAKNIFFNLASSKGSSDPGIRPTGDKLTRFNQMLPLIKAKKIWIAEEMKDTAYGRELMDEIANASTKGFKSRHDDILDTISQLGELDAYKPTEDTASVVEEFTADGSIWGRYDTDNDDEKHSTIF